MRPLYQRLSVWFGFLVFAVLLVVNAFVLRRAVDVQINNSRWIDHTDEVMIELGEIQSMLVDAETAQRGYLYTGEPRYLAPFATAGQVNSHIDVLERLVADNPQQAQLIPSLRELARQKIDELSSTVALYQAGKSAEARATVLSDHGKRIMDQIRDLLRRMRERETDLHSWRSQQTARSQRTTLLSLYGLTVVSLAGLLILCLWILRDIRTRERHAEVIRRQEEWWRVTLTSIGDAVIATDADARITFINPIAESITGFRSREAVGRLLKEVLPLFNEETLEEVPNPIEKVLTTGAIAGLANHTVVKRRNGSFVPIEDSAAPIRDSANQIVGVVLVFRDATQERELSRLQKEAEETVRASEARLQSAASAANMGLWTWNIGTNEILANEQCKALFDVAPGEKFEYATAIGRLHSEDRHKTEAAIAASIKTGGLYNAEYRVVWRDGSVRWISAAGRCSCDDHGQPITLAGACVDITERRTLEEAVRVSHSLSAASRLAHELAHHINNPLAIVTQSLYLLSDRATDPRLKPDLLKAAEDATARVAHISRQLLGLHAPRQSPSLVCLNDLMDDAIHAYVSAFPAGSVEIYRDYHDGAEIFASSSDMRQLCANLLANVFEHAKGGGKIAVRMRQARDPISGHFGVRLVVADNGPGIPDHLRHTIFDAFFSTKDSKGMGLGLWTARGIVNKYGGAIRWKTSTRPQRSGTVFQVFLPTSPEPVRTSERVAVSAQRM